MSHYFDGKDRRAMQEKQTEIPSSSIRFNLFSRCKDFKIETSEFLRYKNTRHGSESMRAIRKLRENTSSEIASAAFDGEESNEL